MASSNPREASGRTQSLVFASIVAVLVICILFSLVGVAFGILFIAIHLIAPGVMIFIASLLSSVFISLQAVVLRLEAISVDGEDGKLPFLRITCSIALPAVIACWLVALAVDLGANDALRAYSGDGATQHSALAVVSICLFTSIVLFCLIKTRHHLLNSGDRKKGDNILPYSNQYQFGNSAPHMRQIQQPNASGRSLNSWRPSNYGLSGYISPSLGSDMSALGIFEQQMPRAHQHRRSRSRHSKPSSPITALPPIRPVPHTERPLRSSEGKTAPVPQFRDSLLDRNRPYKPKWTYIPPSVYTTPTKQRNPHQHRSQHSQSNQVQSHEHATSEKPTTHREHLLRKLSGADRRSSKKSPSHKIRMVPSSPTLGDAYNNSFQSMAGGLGLYRSRGSQDGKRNAQAPGDVVTTPIFDSQAIGTAITLHRSSSSSSVPRQRSPLSLVQIAEEDDTVAPLPQLMPGLESRNLGRISMVYPDECAGGNTDTTRLSTLNKGKKSTEHAMPNAIEPENDKTHMRDTLGPSFRAFADDGRFNDAEDDAALEPAPVTTSPLMMHPVVEDNDVPSPLLIVKKIRPHTASAATSMSNFGRSSNVSEKAYDASSGSSRPSTAATMGDTMADESPPLPPMPLPPTWHQHSLVKKHERIYQQLKAHKGAKLVNVNGKQRTIVPQEDLWKGFEAGADFDEGQATSGATEDSEVDYNRSELWESGSGGVAVTGERSGGRDGAQNRIMDSGDSGDGGILMSSNASRRTIVGS